MAADFELVYNEEECVNEGDMRGKKRIARVEEVAEAYREAQAKGAVAVKIPMKDDKERNGALTFRYRLKSAADALGIKVKISIRQDEELAVVTFVEGGEHASDEDRHSPCEGPQSEFELHVRLNGEKEQPMGTMIDVTQHRGLSDDEAKQAREAGENAYWVKPGRPDELSREGLLHTTFGEYEMHRHGRLEMVMVREREIGGVLDLLRRNEAMTACEAIEALREDADEAGDEN